MERTESEIVVVGLYAKDMLSSDTFNALHKEYTDAMLSAIVTSAPHEAKLREFEYAKVQAIIGFVNHLVGLAEAAEKIINKDTQPIDSDDDDAYDGEDE
jgi:hypothetical protein